MTSNSFPHEARIDIEQQLPFSSDWRTRFLRAYPREAVRFSFFRNRNLTTGLAFSRNYRSPWTAKAHNFSTIKNRLIFKGFLQQVYRKKGDIRRSRIDMTVVFKIVIAIKPMYILSF